MPTVLRTRGYRFFFFSNERQEPPHVHVESAENHAKFWLEPIALAGSEGYHASEVRAIRSLVEQHRELFLERWRAHFGQG